MKVKIPHPSSGIAQVGTIVMIINAGRAFTTERHERFEPGKTTRYKVQIGDTEEFQILERHHFVSATASSMGPLPTELSNRIIQMGIHL